MCYVPPPLQYWLDDPLSCLAMMLFEIVYKKIVSLLREALHSFMIKHGFLLQINLLSSYI